MIIRIIIYAKLNITQVTVKTCTNSISLKVFNLKRLQCTHTRDVPYNNCYDYP